MNLQEFLIAGASIEENTGGKLNEVDFMAVGFSEGKEGPAGPKTTEAVQFVEHGHYAKSHNPPCIPDGASRCATLAVHVPLNAQILSVELAMRFPEHGHWTVCRENADTPLGWSRFGPVGKYTIPSAQVVHVHFKNWVHNGGRYARLKVTYYE